MCTCELALRGSGSVIMSSSRSPVPWSCLEEQHHQNVIIMYFNILLLLLLAWECLCLCAQKFARLSAKWFTAVG